MAKYRMGTFDSEVKQYRKDFSGIAEKKVILAKVDLKNKNAFFSIAPLSRAMHELNADLKVVSLSGKNTNLEILEQIWEASEEMNSKKKNSRTKALEEFVKAVNKKTKSREFEKIVKCPDMVIENTKNNFVLSSGRKIPFRAKWFKPYREKELLKTSMLMLKQGYALKKSEAMSLSFELIPKKKDLDLPLEDYLANFAIARAFALAVLKKGAKVFLGSSTSRFSKLEPMNRLSDFGATIAGCEYSKKSNEAIFKKFRNVSKAFGVHKWRYADASFHLLGKGYGGKHFFGVSVGYPSPDGKTRWPAPGTMLLKPWWHEQSRIDKRMPFTRVAITETLPIDNLIRTCNVDYPKMRKRNKAIKRAIEKCTKLFVKGKKFKAGRTDFVINLIPKGDATRQVMTSDSDMRWKLDREIYKKYKVKSGMFDNFPSGEAFFTPDSIDGTMVGDVVINLDQSYRLSIQNPVVFRFKRGRWKLVSAPASIKKKMKKELSESRALIRLYRKKKSLPERVLKGYEDNFNRIGEFAINTNENAKLSRYLVENEKIARMIHLAMGSGFEPDRQTLYHWDTVIDSPKQKLDIFGTDRKGKEHWIIRKGDFVA